MLKDILQWTNTDVNIGYDHICLKAIYSGIQSNTDSTEAEIALVVMKFSCNNSSV